VSRCFSYDTYTNNRNVAPGTAVAVSNSSVNPSQTIELKNGVNENDDNADTRSQHTTV